MWSNAGKKVSIRAEIVLKLHEDLKKAQVSRAIDEELRVLIEDMRKSTGEDLEDF